MSTRDLKLILADSLHLESELYDFAVECLKKIYDDRAIQAIHAFDEGIEFREYNGCIQSLGCIDRRLTHQEAARKVANFEYTPNHDEVTQ